MNRAEASHDICARELCDEAVRTRDFAVNVGCRASEYGSVCERNFSGKGWACELGDDACPSLSRAAPSIGVADAIETARDLRGIIGRPNQ